MVIIKFLKQKIALIFLILISPFVLAAPTQQVTVLLDWYINPDQAPILLAMSKGYFNKLNLEVELIEPSNSSDAPKFIAQGKADIAISYGHYYTHQIEQGLPVKKIGTLIGSPLVCLIYLPSSGIHSPKDLKGKRIGYSDPNDDFVLLKAVLQAGGLSLNDVTLINVQYDILQSLMMNKIDLAAGMMRNVEPIVLQHHDFKPEVFVPENFNIPSYEELIFIIHSGPTPEKITDFMQAIQEATLDLKQNPDSAWKSIIKMYPRLNTDINHDIWSKTYPFFAHNPEKA